MLRLIAFATSVMLRLIAFATSVMLRLDASRQVLLLRLVASLFIVRSLSAPLSSLYLTLFINNQSTGTILAYVLADHFGLRVQTVDKYLDIIEWGPEECRRVGCSLATFIRKRDTGTAAVEAWKHHYKQLNILFDDVVGFEDFMLTIAKNMFHDTVYGTAYRVGVGAALSLIGECLNGAKR